MSSADEEKPLELSEVAENPQKSSENSQKSLHSPENAHNPSEEAAPILEEKPSLKEIQTERQSESHKKTLNQNGRFSPDERKSKGSSNAWADSPLKFMNERKSSANPQASTKPSPSKAQNGMNITAYDSNKRNAGKYYPTTGYSKRRIQSSDINRQYTTGYHQRSKDKINDLPNYPTHSHSHSQSHTIDYGNKEIKFRVILDRV